MSNGPYLVYTKFAASVSLDIFVRCYNGILKYNYKHFISVKGFYMKLTQRVNICNVDPSFSRPLQTALACCQVTSGPVLASSMPGACQIFFFLPIRLLRVAHKRSMGLRGGEFPGLGPKIFCSPSHLVITFALWQGAPPCWKRHCSSPKCSWMVGRSCSLRMC